MARMIAASSISSAAGTMPAAMMADTASDASSIEAKAASAVRTPSGAWSSRTVTAVTMPSVPSLPTVTPVRSYPGRSATLPPSRASSPAPVTTSSPSTWFTVTPYFKQCGPPAFVDRIREPDVDEPCLHGRRAVRQVDLEDLVHPGRRDHDPALGGRSAADEARARPAGDHGHALPPAESDELHHLGRGAGQGDQLRRALVEGVHVALVRHPPFGRDDEALGPEQSTELGDDGGAQRHGTADSSGRGARRPIRSSRCPPTSEASRSRPRPCRRSPAPPGRGRSTRRPVPRRLRTPRRAPGSRARTGPRGSWPRSRSTRRGSTGGPAGSPWP